MLTVYLSGILIESCTQHSKAMPRSGGASPRGMELALVVVGGEAFTAPRPPTPQPP